jgi:hypothetical protein
MSSLRPSVSYFAASFFFPFPLPAQMAQPGHIPIPSTFEHGYVIAQRFAVLFLASHPKHNFVKTK